MVRLGKRTRRNIAGVHGDNFTLLQASSTILARTRCVDRIHGTFVIQAAKKKTKASFHFFNTNGLRQPFVYPTRSDKMRKLK